MVHHKPGQHRVKSLHHLCNNQVCDKGKSPPSPYYVYIFLISDPSSTEYDHLICTNFPSTQTHPRNVFLGVISIFSSTLSMKQFWNWEKSMTLEFMKHFNFFKSMVLFSHVLYVCMGTLPTHIIYSILCKCTCLVLKDARRGCQMPLDWGYRWFWAIMWVLGTESRSSGRVASSPLLSHFSSPQSSVLFFLSMLLRLTDICLLDVVLCISNYKTSS